MLQHGLGTISFEKLSKFVKCPKLYEIEERFKTPQTFREYLDTTLHKLFMSIVTNPSSIPHIDSIKDIYKNEVLTPPIDVIMPSDTYKTRLINSRMSYIDSFYYHVVLNNREFSKLVMGNMIGNVVIEHTNIEFPVDVVMLGKERDRQSNYRTVILDYSTSETSYYQMTINIRSIITFLGLLNDGVEPIIYWLSLSENKLSRITECSKFSDEIVKDIQDHLSLMKMSISSRRMGFWCNTCKHNERLCIDTME